MGYVQAQTITVKREETDEIVYFYSNCWHTCSQLKVAKRNHIETNVCQKYNCYLGMPIFEADADVFRCPKCISEFGTGEVKR